MPGRPKNPPADRRQEILEAALRVFSHKGYAAATNTDIAREAGVTAAALYYYFPSKADLFKAALTERTALMGPMLREVKEQVGQLPPDVVLPVVIDTMAGFLSEARTQALMSVLLAEAPRNPELVEMWHSQFVAPAAAVVFGYVEAQVQMGRIKPIDPRNLFLTIGGPLLSAVVIRDIIKIPVMQGLTTDSLVTHLKEVVLPALLRQLEHP